MCGGGKGAPARREATEKAMKRMRQERSCQRVSEKIKDWGGGAFSFIAGEGAGQLSRLSNTGHSSSVSGFVSDSLHKSLHSMMALNEHRRGGGGG